MQQVKTIGDNPLRMASLAERRLQRLKTALSFRIEKDSLHVENGAVNLQTLQRRRDRRKTLRPVVPIARAQAYRAAGDKAEQPVAVELDLVDPLLAFRRFIDQRRKLYFRIAVHEALQRGSGLRVRFTPVYGIRAARDLLHRPAGGNTGRQPLQKAPSEPGAAPDPLP